MVGEILVQECPKKSGSLAHALQDRLRVKDLQARQGGGATDGVPSEGMSVKERLITIGQVVKSIIDAVGGHRGRQREIPARDALSQRHDVGHHALQVTGKEFACPSESGCHLIGDEQDIMVVAQPSDARKVSLGRDDHPGRSLYAGLDDHRRDFAAPVLEEVAQRVDARRVALGGVCAPLTAVAIPVWNPQWLEEQRLVRVPERSLTAQAVDSERVAVVSHVQRDDPLAFRVTGIDPILDRHLQRHLDGAGPV